MSKLTKVTPKDKLITLLPSNVKRYKGARVGIELEYERGCDELFNETLDMWHITEDSSLRDYGIEFVSKPLTSKYVRSAVHEVMELVRDFNLVPTIRCGVHVHLNATDLKFKELWNITVLYLLLEQHIFKHFAEGREENHFCVPLGQNYQLLELIKQDADKLKKGIMIRLPEPKKKVPKPHFLAVNSLAIHELSTGGASAKKLSIFSSSKYSAVNFQTLWRLGTVEFRHLHGTANADKVINWVDFLLQLREEACMYDKAEDIIEDYMTYGPRFLLQRLGLPQYDIDRELQEDIIDSAYDACGKTPTKWQELVWFDEYIKEEVA